MAKLGNYLDPIFNTILFYKSLMRYNRGTSF